MKLLGKYINGNYTVSIYDDGTKVRENDLDNLTPAFAESIDCNITTKCDGGCSYCYLNCTPDGKHTNFFDYDTFIESLHPYTEIALNGNDMSHPQLVGFLKKLKSKKVIPNITVNQKHFIRYYNYIKALVDCKLIYGVGISLTDSKDTEFIEKVKTLPNAIVHTICGVTKIEDYEILINNKIKILILGYKSIGRGLTYANTNYYTLRLEMRLLEGFISVLLKSNRNALISFDNLALEQLHIKSMLPEDIWNESYMGDDGKYTFYVDLVEGKFSKNSLSNIKYDMNEMTIDEMFDFIREKE